MSEKIEETKNPELASVPDDIVIARNFVRIRQSMGLTQAQTARLGGVSTGYVGKIETAAVSFGTKAQQKWSRLFKVDRSTFLRRPDVGIGVVGVVTNKGIIEEHSPGHALELLPSLTGYESDSVFCVKVSTDTLYPHLRRDSCLYITTVPLSAVRNDNFVIYAGQGEPAGIKEVERLDDGKILLKGVGKGSTVTKEATELTTMQKVIFIGM